MPARQRPRPEGCGRRRKKLRGHPEQLFWHRLTLALGHKSIAHAKRAIDSDEFARWMAYYRVEPFGERVADLRMGQLAALIANVNRNSKVRPDPYLPIDFMPWVEERKASEPVLFENPKDQAKFVALALFGVDLSQGDGKKFKVKRRRQ
ncbi:phage tail assembly protein T [Burkholderia gladioli]|uniref:phage tail assembly protein T n=1 Tax=Burkholderia gladioli TaxID=28095 RepID=UPI003C79D2B5